MATWIKVRAISRSQQIRIGKTRVERGTTVAVDLEDGKTRRDLERHQALGAVITVAGITATAGDAVVSGAVVDEGTNAADMAIRVTAGVLRKQSDGSEVTIAAATPSVTAADATNPRIDNVVTNLSGTVSIVAGTPAATPAAPAVAAGTVKIAEILVPANDTAITNSQITDWTPSRYKVATA